MINDQLYDDALAAMARITHELAEKHNKPDGGELVHALFNAWTKTVSTILCPGCTRQMFHNARQELFDKRADLPREHLH